MVSTPFQVSKGIDFQLLNYIFFPCPFSRIYYSHFITSLRRQNYDPSCLASMTAFSTVSESLISEFHGCKFEVKLENYFNTLLLILVFMLYLPVCLSIITPAWIKTTHFVYVHVAVNSPPKFIFQVVNLIISSILFLLQKSVILLAAWWLLNPRSL